jgi:WD40 repeat protein
MAVGWRTVWRTDRGLDPRMRFSNRVGSVVAAAAGVAGDRLFVAALTGDVAGAGDVRLHVWDVLSDTTVTRSAAGARCVTLAQADGPVVVTGHAHGTVRVWTVPGLLPLQAFTIGTEDVDIAQAVMGEGDAILVTLDRDGQLGRWSLATGKLLGTLDASRPFTMTTARSVNGRRVTAAAGESLSLWDIDTGDRLPLPITDTWRNGAALVWSVSSVRDLLTLATAGRQLVTLDPVTGVQVAPAIKRHVNNYTQGMNWIWEPDDGRPQLAAAGGVLAVPTRWSIHLWKLATSESAGPPLAGPVGRSLVQAIGWQGHDWLLTGSAEDGVLALWDLDVPVARPIGHDERISRVSVADHVGVVVSADDGGTLVAHRIADGVQVAAPTRTGVEGILALAVWGDGEAIVAATGSGSRRWSHRWLQRWNLNRGEQQGDAIDLDAPWLRHLVVASVRGEQVLVTAVRDGRLDVWRATDGTKIATLHIPGRLLRLVRAEVDGRPLAVVSTFDGAPVAYRLDDLAAPPLPLPDIAGDFIVAMNEVRLVAGCFAEDASGWRSVRAWDLSGNCLGPYIHGPRVTSVAIARWPAVYIARLDGTITLTDVTTGEDRCPPLQLPIGARDIAATADGDLLAGFGLDIARFRPPML